MAELINEKDSLNTGRKKLNNAIVNADEAKQNSSEALNIANSANGKANQAISDARAALQYTVGKYLAPVNTFNDIATTYPIPNENDRVFVRDTGKVYIYQDSDWMEFSEITVGPVDEVDKRLSRKISQTLDYSRNIKVVNRGQPKPTMIIMDDDTRKELFTKLFPLAQSLGIPITSAAITSRIGVEENYITLEEFEIMRESGLVEFISHTHTHRHLANLTDEEIEYELSESKKWLEKHGVNTNFVVYPFGSIDERVIRLTKKYYDAGFKTSSLAINELPLKTYELVRANFDRTIEQLKQDIDNAFDKDALIVINTHSQYESFTENKFVEMVNYAKSKGFEFSTVEDALKIFGNLVESNVGIIDARGDGHGELSSGMRFIENAGITIETPITFFRKNVISTCRFTHLEAQDAGFGEAGMLFTDRRSNDDYSTQYYEYLQNNVILRRRWVSGQWSEFMAINPEAYRPIENAVTIDTTPEQMNSLMRRNPFYTIITRSGASGFPHNEPGLLYTDITRGNGFSYQIYHLYNSPNVYKRIYNNGWTEFTLISSYKSPTNAITAHMRPEDMTAEQRTQKFDTKITRANAEGFPGNEAGICTTDVSLGAGYNYQVYQLYNSNKMYRRYDTGSNWSQWEEI